MKFLGGYNVTVFRVCVQLFYISCGNFFAYTVASSVSYLCVCSVKSFAVEGGVYYGAVHQSLGACAGAAGVSSVFWV